MMELLFTIFLVVLTVFVAMSFYYEHPKAKIPPGISQRKKLYVFHYIMNFGFGLATLMEKIGITSEVHFLRILMDGIPPPKDKHLFIKDLRFEKIKVRMYQPTMSTTGQRRGILYFHGGVGRFGSIQAYERTCRYIAKKTNSVVVSVGYRLAPEYPYPTQFEDCLTATVHFMRTAQNYGVDPSRIIVCGDSSGGTLTAAVAQALVNRKDVPKLRAQILIYPFLQGADFNLPSYQQNEGIPILLKERTISLGFKYLNKDLSAIKNVLQGCHVSEELRLKYQKWLSADNIPHEFKTRGYTPSTEQPFSEEIYTLVKTVFEPVFSPLLSEDSVIAQLPETFILTCEYDVLRDDGLLYKKRLEDQGVKVTLCHLQEGFHGTIFLALYAEFETALKRGERSRKDVSTDIKERSFNPATILLFCDPQYERDLDILERIQRGATAMSKGLEHLSCERAGTVQPGEEEAQRDLSNDYKYLREECKEDRARLDSPLFSPLIHKTMIPS